MTRLIEVTDRAGQLIEPEWLARAEPVHRQLRPQLPADYSAKMARVFADGGRMLIAVQDDRVRGVAVWRAYDNTCDGLHLYVDDLVTDEKHRSSGVGRSLLTRLEGLARDAGCRSLTLDSGTQRTQAHKFYFREGMIVSGFHFHRTLA